MCIETIVHAVYVCYISLYEQFILSILMASKMVNQKSHLANLFKTTSRGLVPMLTSRSCYALHDGVVKFTDKLNAAIVQSRHYWSFSIDVCHCSLKNLLDLVFFIQRFERFPLFISWVVLIRVAFN